MTGIQLVLLRITLHLACAVPLCLLAIRFASNNLGVNPLETLLEGTGIWALRFVLISLAMRPLYILLKDPITLSYRRLFGLWAFTYAITHFTIYLVFDLNFSIGGWLVDVQARPFIAAGSGALLLLLPLAITSTKGWQRRLKRRWLLLHRLVYPASMLAVIHYAWQIRGFRLEPWFYIAVLVLMLSIRIFASRAKIFSRDTK